MAGKEDKKNFRNKERCKSCHPGEVNSVSNMKMETCGNGNIKKVTPLNIWKMRCIAVAGNCVGGQAKIGQNALLGRFSKLLQRGNALCIMPMNIYGERLCPTREHQKECSLRAHFTESGVCRLSAPGV